MDSTVQAITQILVIVVVLALMALLLAILWFANLADRQRQLAGRPDQAAMSEVVPAGPPPDTVLVETTLTAAAPNTASANSGHSFAVLAYLLLALLYGLLLLVGIATQASAGLTVPAAANAAAAVLSPAMQRACGLGLWLPALAGLVLMLPPVRRLVSRLIPIDPRSTVHAIALAYTMMVLINLVISVVTLSTEAANIQGSENPLLQSPSTLIITTWMQDIYFFVLAVVGVGWLSRRSLAAAARRLGLVAPTRRQVGLGIALGLAMIPLVVVLTGGAQLLGIPQNTDVEKISQALVGPLTQSIGGILTLGLAAALGEEAVFRGALLPRFGLVFTTLLFAAMHGQYAISVSTVVVIILGLVLGVLRQRTNTTTSMIAHAVYNSSLGLLAFLNIMK